MRQFLAASLGCALASVICIAQAEEITQAEQKLAEARRTGQGLRSLFADDYFDIIPPGTTRTGREAAACSLRRSTAANQTCR